MNFLKQMETLFQAGTASGQSDGQLLERFVQRRDETAEAAFAALVDRHGAMVLRVCRQVLGDEHDAQDASQATFLVLARRAGSIGRRESVASWLHGVAMRVAAKARQAGARRRVREQRGGEMMATRRSIAVEQDENPEHFAQLHDELRGLSASFREPLVLCYLEGLTQEQVAAQLRCPLGTVQSRLARGRAKLKSRLTKRGFELSAVFSGAGLGTLQPSAAPDVWTKATVRLAMQFTRAKGSVTAMTSAALAHEVLANMLIEKLKASLTISLFAAVIISAAARWAIQEATVVATEIAAPLARYHQKQEPVPVPAQPLAPNRIERSMRGIVRDEQGKPVAKAWIGASVRSRLDVWKIVSSPNRVRECRQPFRDEHGEIVPPGALDKYFERVDDEGRWHPVHPHDIRLYRPSRPRWEGVTLEEPTAAPAPPMSGLLEVRVVKGGHRMTPLMWMGGPDETELAERSDADGQFAVGLMVVPGDPGSEVHVASPDFLRRGTHVVKADDPDEAVEITLRPVRQVRARVIEAPNDDPLARLNWYIYTLDERAPRASYLKEIHARGALVYNGLFDHPPADISPDEKRWFEAFLAAGRYRIRFESLTTVRLVDIVVPAGDGPLDLPDIRLETVAWIKMTGTPAREIEAIDMDGKPVRLADYRGKVVVLIFWSTGNEAGLYHPGDLAALKKRFPRQPLEILLLHDASVISLADYRKTAMAMQELCKLEQVPFRLLLDRPPSGNGAASMRPLAGEPGSGRSAEMYEIAKFPTTVVIDKTGKMVLSVQNDLPMYVTSAAMGKHRERVVKDVRDQLDGNPEENIALLDPYGYCALVWALEDEFGLPRSRAMKLSPLLREESLTANGPRVVKGRVVDLAGAPVVGAKLTPMDFNIAENQVTSDARGEFRFTATKVPFNPGDAHDPGVKEINLKVEAPSLATGILRIDTSFADHADFLSDEHLTIDKFGAISGAFTMSPGVTVTGRVFREARPVAGATVELRLVERPPSFPDQTIETKTDEQGAFHFRHVLPETEFWASVKLGTLEGHGTVIPARFETTEEGSTFDVGELKVERGRTLAGRVVCADGKVAPHDAAVVANCPNAAGSLQQRLSTGGRFEFKGLPEGPVSISVLFPGTPAAAGYRISPRNKCRNPRQPGQLSGHLDHDITDLTILLEPGQAAEAASLSSFELDLALIADFDDAKTGPIIGVPPGP
jgi:RNA polymerase sigma factor (sigma-70 family)